MKQEEELYQPDLDLEHIEIVVSRYNESLSWMDEYPFSLFTYTIYNKGSNDDFLKKQDNKVIDLDNLGRCDHTYLYHIVSNYDNLKPITIFFPGCLDMSNKKPKAVDLLKGILKTKCAIFPSEVCSNIHDKFKNFALDHWKSSYNKNHLLYVSTFVSPAKLRPYGKWYKFHFGNKRVKYYSINSIFSLDKRDILKFPISRYSYFCNMLSSHSHPEACHYMERSWGALFGPFLYTKLKY